MIQFSSDLFTTTEDAGVITITMTRTYATDGTVTVDYATTDGTSTSGSDYIPVSGTIASQNIWKAAKAWLDGRTKMAQDWFSGARKN
ncbi:MAG: hypothetical protein OMM_12545 [Candidatus Magnetoglobus multicellularis str. Araruama]|uniref:Calx-beta domain-containing protein n=1 Tax=Candidatus Magnetoglobus multicellularis str. Araruama TaxID=890399 RepID=A0A1V1NVQ1_9BACT|nr:MAG: hypothetical protein OMM_12545 [Candidatus Magnetoglobus multicellularis str. Araruama]